MTSSAILPLQPGDQGPAVRDLQRRLARSGLDTALADAGTYGARTESAVRRFQELRGLRTDGCCGSQTWSALVEAGFRLGDRLLYHRTPMLRGDDVADLQHRLGALGFLSGRADGILGPDTATALIEFQRNLGLSTDGICGPETVTELTQLGKRAGQQLKAGVIESERLRRSPRHLLGRHVVVGETGGLRQLAAAIERTLRLAGAVVLTSHHPDESSQAAEANAFAAEVYLGLGISQTPGATIAYYGSPTFTSRGGERLAALAAEELAHLVPPAAGRAMRLPVLRETKMSAVVCEIGPPGSIVEQVAPLASGLGRALARWVDAPLEA